MINFKKTGRGSDVSSISSYREERPHDDGILRLRFDVLIEGAESEEENLQIFFKVVHGKDWRVVSGHNSLSGWSQGVSANQLSSQRLVWNIPIKLGFECDSVAGWPRLAVALYGHDFLGRSVVRAYGCCILPMSEKTTLRRVPLFSLEESSEWDRLVNWLRGSNVQLRELQSVLGEGEGRAGLRTRSNGFLLVRGWCAGTNFDRSGYKLG